MGLSYSVMDHLDYGLSDPKLVLMKDGNVFLAGQLQEPMDPPLVPRAMKWDPNTKSFQSLMSSMPLFVMSAVLGVVATAPEIEVESVTINQGVERFLIDQHQADGTSDPINRPNRVWKNFAWKTTVPKIAGRRAKLRFYLRSNTKLDKAVKFRYSISYSDGTHTDDSFDVQPNEWNKTLGVISGVPELTLEASKVQAGAKLTIELDPTNQLVSFNAEEKKQKGMLIENVDMGFRTSNAMTVNLFPFRYYVDKAQQGVDHPTAEFTKADLIAARVRFGEQWKKLFPVPKVTVIELDSVVEFDLAEQKRNPSSTGIQQMLQGDNVFGALMYMATFVKVAPIEKGGLNLPDLKPANSYYLCLVPTGAALVNKAGRVLTDADFQNGTDFAGATHPTGHIAALFQNRDGSEYRYGATECGRVNSAHEMGHMHSSGHATRDDGTHDAFWDSNWPGGPYAKSGVGVGGWDVVIGGNLNEGSFKEIMSDKWLPWVSDYTFAKWCGYENPGSPQTIQIPTTAPQAPSPELEVRPKQVTPTPHGDYKVSIIPAKVEQYTYQRATNGAFLLDVSGLVHDENGRAEIDYASLLSDSKRGEAYKKQGSENLIEIRLSSGEVRRFPCYFSSFKSDSHPSHTVNFARFRWNAILPAIENAVGYRLIELKNGLELPVAEETFDTLRKPDLDIRMAPKNVVEWRIWPRNGSGATISWDRGKTWEAPKGVGGYIELPAENLQQNPEPWIEFNYSLNFRLTRKTYQVGKGFIQASLSTGFTVHRAETTSAEF